MSYICIYILKLYYRGNYRQRYKILNIYLHSKSGGLRISENLEFPKHPKKFINKVHYLTRFHLTIFA